MESNWTHRLTLIFALLACIIPSLSDAIAEIYPDPGLYFNLANLTRGEKLFMDADTVKQLWGYRGYTVHERARAGAYVLGNVFSLLAFFRGRAAARWPQGRKRDICLVAATFSVCSIYFYMGSLVSILLFLVLMLRLQQKDGNSTEEAIPPESA